MRNAVSCGLRGCRGEAPLRFGGDSRGGRPPLGSPLWSTLHGSTPAGRTIETKLLQIRDWKLEISNCRSTKRFPFCNIQFSVYHLQWIERDKRP